MVVEFKSDQMARYLVFDSDENSPIAKRVLDKAQNFAQLPKTFNISPKLQHFAKSAHIYLS